ncbi:MAG: GAF domain-containing protein [Anaerolineae bacterium]|nr:GAF domain-containing protein [Anaerolineae bacterium]
MPGVIAQSMRAPALTSGIAEPNQALPPGGEDLRFDRISLEEGLSQSSVHCILQDSDGFMWFGTSDGLNRYDGYEFTVFKHDVENSYTLAHNHINALLEDSSGILWIGAEGGGLDRFDRKTERFTHYRHDPGDPQSLANDFVKALYEDVAGNLWIGSPTGLSRLDRRTQIITTYHNDFDPPEEIHGTNYVVALARGPENTLWVGTQGGLIHFDPATEIFTAHTNPSNVTGANTLTTLYQDRTGTLWIGTEGGGLYIYDPRQQRYTRFHHDSQSPTSLDSNFVTALYEDLNGTLWVGTDSGLNRLLLGGAANQIINEAEERILERIDLLAPGNVQFTHYEHDPANPYGLSDRLVASLYVDEAGVVWIGTGAGGINKFDPQRSKFAHYRANPDEPGTSLSADTVNAILEDREGGIWVGASRSGLDHLDRTTGRVTHYRHSPNNDRSISTNRVNTLYEDREGVLWIGTAFGAGLSRWDRTTGYFHNYSSDSESSKGLNYPYTNVIFEDSAGNLWIGTSVGGLNKLNRDTGLFTYYQYREPDRTPDTIGYNYIHAIIEDRTTDVLWLGTLGGLAKFDPQTTTFTFYIHDPENSASLANDMVWSLHQDRNGILWVGTNSGLDRFDPVAETFTHFTESEGLPNNVVVGILEDNQGNLWISTYRGLSMFVPRIESFRNYDTGDGLQSLEFTRATFRSSNGEMFFGGINGFNAFFPESIANSRYDPPVVVTDFQIFNAPVAFGPDSVLTQPIAQTRQIELSYRDSVFSFEIASLHYAAPDENQYAYMMEPFDDDWNYIGTRRFATYTNLRPGRYTFQARGTNSDGVWSDNVARIDIVISPPFWQRWWFIAGAVLTLLGTGAAGYSWRIRQIEARNRELETTVRERTYEIERRRQVAEGLREILLLLNSNRSLKESLDYIVQHTAQLTDAEHVLVFRYETDTAPVIISCTGAEAGSQAGVDLPPEVAHWMSKTVLRGEILSEPELTPAQARALSEALVLPGDYRALLGIPLSFDEGTYGGLVLFYQQPRAFSEEDLQLGSTFADQAALAIANNQLREQAAELAAATERNRLARDLHDAVTQTLFSASLIAETLPALWESDRDDSRKLLLELRQLTRGALAEMRSLLLELRPTALVEANLGDLLRQLAEAMIGRTGLPVTVDVTGECHLATSVHVALYRIAQEALNNVVKHARASHVWVTLRCIATETGRISRERVELEIRDNGRGFDLACVPPDCLGLHILRERAEAVGAALELQSNIGQGTWVFVTWPGENRKQEQV